MYFSFHIVTLWILFRYLYYVFNIFLNFSITQTIRDGPTNKVRAKMSISSALIFGSIFWRMGFLQTAIQDRMGLLQVPPWYLHCWMSTCLFGESKKSSFLLYIIVEVENLLDEWNALIGGCNQHSNGSTYQDSECFSKRETDCWPWTKQRKLQIGSLFVVKIDRRDSNRCIISFGFWDNIIPFGRA